MAIALGTQNKRQVRLVVGLIIAIVVIGGWEGYNAMGTSSAKAAVKPVTPLRTTTAPIRKSNRSRLDPVLRIEELDRSELVEYTGTGRDVFSAMAEPVVMESPIAPARPSDLAASLPPLVEPPKPPSMDLKYLGFAQTTDKTYTALFTHGDDMFMAKTGDIMFHRFRVGLIQPSSVQVTDLTRNLTQNIAVVASN
jgi:hypothetical protein